MLIPREGGYMVRFYVELDKLGTTSASRAARSPARTDAGAARARPYTIEVKEVAWLSVYEVGQRLTTDSTTAEGSDGGRRGCSSPATPAIPIAPRPDRA